MKKEEILDFLSRHSAESPLNRLTEGEARMFDVPLVGFASASDPLFSQFREEGVIGAHALMPGDILPGAGTVISLFVPISEYVRKSNRADPTATARHWLNLSHEGKAYLNSMCDGLLELFAERGVRAVIPARTPEIKMTRGSAELPEPGWEGRHFTSNWSERHVAYACGLGTFGLAGGFISAAGMAGRLCSFVVDAEFEPTERDYTAPMEYCIRCGACVRRCPAAAISRETGPDPAGCFGWQQETAKVVPPRYGCGKCQVAVPCEARAPGRKMPPQK